MVRCWWRSETRIFDIKRGDKDQISIGNQMISSAIFSKTNKIGECNLWSLKKFTSAYLFQIARQKSFDYLLIIYMKTFLHAD